MNLLICTAPGRHFHRHQGIYCEQRLFQILGFASTTSGFVGGNAKFAEREKEGPQAIAWIPMSGSARIRTRDLKLCRCCKSEDFTSLQCTYQNVRDGSTGQSVERSAVD
jgi:hypothetical protein